MIVLLKMDASDNIFDKICLKAIRDTFFFQYVVYDQGTGGLNFLVGVISNILACKDTLQTPSIIGTSWSPHRNTLRKGHNWSAYCNDFEKSE